MLNPLVPLPFDPHTIDLDPLLRQLHLSYTRTAWVELVAQCDSQNVSCREFLVRLLTAEVATRQQSRIRKSTHQARFPFLKTIEEFDFSLQPHLRLATLGPFLGPEMVTEGRCLILQGEPGRGKTHIAIAIAYRAILNGFIAKFTHAAELIDHLSAESRKGNLRQALTAYVNPHVLIIDEVGYLSHGPEAANVLFHVVQQRHAKKKPMIFTTNKAPLTQWGDVLHDKDLADTIVDRVLERGRLIVLQGPSYRTKHLPKLDQSSQQHDHQLDTISGKNATQFPEPTRAFSLALLWSGRRPSVRKRSSAFC